MAKLWIRGHLFFIFVLLFTVYHSSEYSQISGKMSAVKYKPFDAGLLYNITIANETSCSVYVSSRFTDKLTHFVLDTAQSTQLIWNWRKTLKRGKLHIKVCVCPMFR